MIFPDLGTICSAFPTASSHSLVPLEAEVLSTYLQFAETLETQLTKHAKKLSWLCITVG
jgi:hypothetical protein